MPGVRDIKIRFSGDATGLTKAASEGEKSVGRFSDRTQKVAKVALAGVGAFALGIAGALKSGVEGVQEGEEANARFADALSRSSAKIRAQADALQANADQVQKNTRFTYEAALGASTFLAAQDGVKRAVDKGVVSMTDATNITLDLATVMNTDATSAAGILSKALAAPERASRLLQRAGVVLTAAEDAKVKAWVKSGNVAAAQGLIMDKLKAKTEGAAEAAGQTTAGQLERARNAFGEVQENLAVALIPTITKLMQWLLKVTAWAQDNPGKMKLIVIVLGSLAAVIGTVSLAITVWTSITRTAAAVQAAWNAVMAANPLVLVTLAVVGLIAVIVLIATKTRFFQNTWSAAMSAVKSAISSVFGWIRDNWPLVLAILTGPVGIAVAAVVKNFDRIKSAAVSVKDAIVRAFSTVADVITRPFTAAVSAIRNAWNSVLGGKGIHINVGGQFGLPSFGVNFDIPRLAAGGTARAGMAHMVGERGPELFIPGRTGTVVPNDALGGDIVVELHGNREALEAVVEKVVVRRDRATKLAVQAGSRRAFA